MSDRVRRGDELGEREPSGQVPSPPKHLRLFLGRSPGWGQGGPVSCDRGQSPPPPPPSPDFSQLPEIGPEAVGLGFRAARSDASGGLGAGDDVRAEPKWAG